MTTPFPAIDVTEISTLAICPLRGCGWRTLQLSEDLARLRYAEHYQAKHRPSAPVAQACSQCGSTHDVMPRKVLCTGCHKAQRAAKARAAYKTKGRAGRRAS